MLDSLLPDLKLKKPGWLRQPSAMTVFSFILFSYFLVCAGTWSIVFASQLIMITLGIIYDVIVEPPSIGTTVDEHGHSRPVAFMPYRVNGQYIMEGIASSFLFTTGALGFIVLDKTHDPLMPKLNRILLITIGFICIIVSFFTTWIFMRMKLP